MREPNLSFPSQNRAAICITSALYDRRALDCTATLPMINSLTHLAYLTSTSPRIREILVLDGGLEQLVHVLSAQHLPNDLRSLWKWSLAFQCVVNIGVRGTEQIRTRVVDAGMIPIVLRVLQSFLRALEIVTKENEHNKKQQEAAAAAAAGSSLLAGEEESVSAAVLQEAGSHILSNAGSNSNNSRNGHLHQPSPFMLESGSELASSGFQFSPAGEATNGNSREATPEEETTATADLCHAPQTTSNTTTNSTPLMRSSPKNSKSDSRYIPPIRQNNPLSLVRRTTFPYVKMSREQRRRNRFQQQDTAVTPGTVAAAAASNTVNVDTVFYREEDILMSLQLLAYLSKYPHIRHQFHTAYSVNVFSVVEKFTFRVHPSSIHYWAGVIMRNACRKDETQGGIRRCANMHCGKWEQKPREFAKCRRCRKAKYCSKSCQSKAWNDGHRWWCVERQSTVAAAAAAAAAAATSSASAAAAVATPSAPLPAINLTDAPATNMPASPTITHITAVSADQGPPQHQHQ